MGVEVVGGLVDDDDDADAGDCPVITRDELGPNVAEMPTTPPPTG